MLRSWISGKKAQVSSSSQSLRSDGEIQALEQAMAAATLVLNDDIDGAEAGLKEGESSFHKLGLGVVTFLRAALGMEKEIMKEAQESLWAADAQASIDLKRTQKDSGAFKSSIYEPGAEYLLISAECLLMGAVVGLLTESVTEALKGFYNMRKAYNILNSIADSETRYMSTLKTASVVSFSSTIKSGAGTGSNSKAPSVRSSKTSVKKEPGQLTEKEEIQQERLGEAEMNGIAKDLSSLNVGDKAHSSERRGRTNQESKQDSENNDSELFSHPIDAYIHSGTSMCYGGMLLILSLIPPAFGRILSMIGFRGDRERGMKMLWQASEYNNVNGAIAGLILLGYFNGTMAFCDIILEANPNSPHDAPENVTGFPMERLEALLAKMRRRFPKSGLWKLEETRMLAAQRRVEESLPMLEQSFDSSLKQIAALGTFERSLQAMYCHRYQLCADSYVECTKLNQWSHAMYFYIAGTAHVELYRLARASGDDATAEAEAKKVDELFAEVREHAGKRRFMSRQMPFEAFITRKLAKWDERSKALDVPLIDAISASPLEEMRYFWNGYKKMTDDMLEKSLKCLDWSDKDGRDPHWATSSADERAVLAIARSATLRSLRRWDEAKEELRTGVLAPYEADKAAFKGGNKDDYPPAVAHYEMATILWQERTHRGTSDEGSPENVKRITEAQDWLDKARTWESYTLDARIGLKITAGTETLKQWLAKHGEQSS